MPRAAEPTPGRRVLRRPSPFTTTQQGRSAQPLPATRQAVTQPRSTPPARSGLPGPRWLTLDVHTEGGGRPGLTCR